MSWHLPCHKSPIPSPPPPNQGVTYPVIQVPNYILQDTLGHVTVELVARDLEGVRWL